MYGYNILLRDKYHLLSLKLYLRIYGVGQQVAKFFIHLTNIFRNCFSPICLLCLRMSNCQDEFYFL